MIYTRQQLAASIEAGILADDEITATYKVVPEPRDLGELDPAIDCYIQIVRQRIVPAEANPRGQWNETHEVWVIEKTTGVDSEDRLDDRLAEVLDVLRGVREFTFKSAERRVHKSERQAWMLAGEIPSYPITE